MANNSLIVELTREQYFTLCGLSHLPDSPPQWKDLKCNHIISILIPAEWIGLLRFALQPVDGGVQLYSELLQFYQTQKTSTTCAIRTLQLTYLDMGKFAVSFKGRIVKKLRQPQWCKWSSEAKTVSRRTQKQEGYHRLKQQTLNMTKELDTHPRFKQQDGKLLRYAHKESIITTRAFAVEMARLISYLGKECLKDEVKWQRLEDDLQLVSKQHSTKRKHKCVSTTGTEHSWLHAIGEDVKQYIKMYVEKME